ncbi:D-ribitol-5-phosphate cytidylyltransferase-like isoform X2 [Myxocyprinus asiaticus]|uniref:D-ribitol-5-phosphate cytidylyltransferase-like isoform X2 n=1 Tax=Myxocyprinus asiaticus TaxID=70543 RepID=UPI0022224FFD|nr:D-ribitol-5-phosphate cytidylyltransferase-like isoform X2 [Myxocyprinus asiaticus]
MQEESGSSSYRPLDPGCLFAGAAERSGDRPGHTAVDFPVAVVLPAGGSGERMGLPTPKQFCTILDRPLISYTIQAFERLSWIGTIVVVIAKENHDLMLNIVRKFNHTKVKVVHGGTTRHRSIFNGLQAFSNTSDDSLTPKPKVVIIHDAVRPFVEEDLLLKITLAAKEQGASGAIRPLVSTVIATTSEGYLDHSLERAKYRASEMPQGFLYDIIFQAYQRVTYKRDLAAAEAIIKETLSMSAYIITEADAEAVKLARTLQKNLATLNMMVTDIIPCAKEINSDSLSKTLNFIQISENGSNFSGVLEMVKSFEDTNHSRLYPVVIVWVQLNMTKQSFDTQKADDLKAFMGLASEVLQGNILLYGIQTDHSKVPEQWERSVERLAQITVALIRDRNAALTGQILQA